MNKKRNKEEWNGDRGNVGERNTEPSRKLHMLVRSNILFDALLQNETP